MTTHFIYLALIKCSFLLYRYTIIFSIILILLLLISYLSSETALYFLQLTMPKVIFCNEKSVDVILRAIKEKNCSPLVVVFGKHDGVISFSDILRNCNDEEVANFRYVKIDDLKRTVCILHSSGTTGISKGVELSSHSISIISQEKKLCINNEPSLWFSSLYWMSGIMMNFIAITSNSTVILYPQFDEEMLCRLIEKYKVILHYT